MKKKRNRGKWRRNKWWKIRKGKNNKCNISNILHLQVHHSYIRLQCNKGSRICLQCNKENRTISIRLLCKRYNRGSLNMDKLISRHSVFTCRHQITIRYRAFIIIHMVNQTVKVLYQDKDVFSVFKKLTCSQFLILRNWKITYITTPTVVPSVCYELHSQLYR